VNHCWTRLIQLNCCFFVVPGSPISQISAFVGICHFYSPNGIMSNNETFCIGHKGNDVMVS